MNSNDELFEMAHDYFNENNFSQAEPLLNQLILKGSKKPEVFYMLGSIFYDYGKFKKAIKSFERALQIDPGFTDASVGLSIVLNDLGKYEKGREVFAKAQEQLKEKNKDTDEYINEQLSIKHQQLAELYFRIEKYSEALEQYLKAYQICKQKVFPLYGACDCFLKLGHTDKAVMLYNNIIKKYPKDVTAHLKLAQVYYDHEDIIQAVEICENILKFDPDNSQAQSLLYRAQSQKYKPLQLNLQNNPSKNSLNNSPNNKEDYHEATFE